MNQRSTGKPRFGAVIDSGRPPEPPEIEDEDDDHGDGDEEGDGGYERIVQLLPAEGWVAKYELGEAPVVCWALVQEFCEHGHHDGERIQGMVIPPGWAFNPAPYWIFTGSPDDGLAFGEFLGFERQS